MSIKIRPLEMNDFPEWLALWDGNNSGKRDEEVTTELWGRLHDPVFPVHSIVAEKNGKLVGMVQYVLHFTTGKINQICYMQDVYVDPAQRKQGIARKLVKYLANIAKQEKWGRMYWIAERDNIAAQNLYKNLGVEIDFTVHVLLP